MTIANVRARLLVIAALCVLSVGRSSTQAPTAADGPWAGWAQCVLQGQFVGQGQTYLHLQTHTWVLTGATPLPPPASTAALKQYAATWQVTGQGTRQRGQGSNTEQWTTAGQPMADTLTIRMTAEGNVRIGGAAQLRSVGTTTGTTLPYVDEWPFPVIEGPATQASITGSASSAAPNFTGAPPGTTSTSLCSWNFVRGGAAPPPPPPRSIRDELGIQGPGTAISGLPRVPQATSAALPPAPPLSGGGPSTPPPGVAVGASPAPPPGNTPLPGAAPGVIAASPVPGPPPGNTPLPGAAPGVIAASPVPASPPGATPTPPPGNTPLPGGSVPASPASGTYLVTVTGLICGQSTTDNLLNTDGRGDEIYAAAYVRRYDRRDFRLLEFNARQTLVYGDINQAPQRRQAGTASGQGGIRTLDKIPSDLSVARVAPAQDTVFPWRLWQGTLTDTVDALVISPSIWEWDGSPQVFANWMTNQTSLNNSIFLRTGVQNQMSANQFSPVVFDESSQAVAGGLAPIAGAAASTLIPGVGIGMPIVKGLLSGSYDRPFGLIPNGLDSTVLRNTAVVLTREIIEAALRGTGVPIPTSSPGVVVMAPKPGIMVISFVDIRFDFSAAFESPGAYYMILQVERLSGAPTASATPVPASQTTATAAPVQVTTTSPAPTQTATAAPVQVTTTSPPQTATPTQTVTFLPGSATAGPTPTQQTTTASNLPTAAGRLPGAAVGVSDGAVAAPVPRSIQDEIASCTLPGPTITSAYASPIGASLKWDQASGVTNYRLLRSDLGFIADAGVATTSFLGQQRLEAQGRVRHSALLAPGSTYVYIVEAVTPSGCGATGRNVTATKPTPALTACTGICTVDTPIPGPVPIVRQIPAGQYLLRWRVGVLDVTGVHLQGDGLPSQGVDVGPGNLAPPPPFPGLPVTGPTVYDAGDATGSYVVSVGYGTLSWTAYAYWDVGGQRIRSDPTSTTIVRPRP